MPGNEKNAENNYKATEKIISQVEEELLDCEECDECCDCDCDECEEECDCKEDECECHHHK